MKRRRYRDAPVLYNTQFYILNWLFNARVCERYPNYFTPESLLLTEINKLTLNIGGSDFYVPTVSDDPKRFSTEKSVGVDDLSSSLFTGLLFQWI